MSSLAFRDTAANSRIGAIQRSRQHRLRVSASHLQRRYFVGSGLGRCDGGKGLVNNGLAEFNLDDRLAENTGVDPRQNSVRIHETLGNALYWLVFLLFLPLILNALELNGLLQPVQNLIDQFFNAIPQILKALLIFGAGWLLAKIVRGIVTNLLSATGVDNLGRRLGLSRAPRRAAVYHSPVWQARSSMC